MRRSSEVEGDKNLLGSGSTVRVQLMALLIAWRWS